MSETNHDLRFSPSEETPGEVAGRKQSEAPKQRSVAEASTSFLNGIPGRAGVLATVGAALYLAADPTELDGLSDAEFLALRNAGPGFFSALENLSRLSIPERFRLPSGFTEHFTNQVLEDLKIIRSDDAKSKLYRTELQKILSNKGLLDSMYTKHHDTFSDLTSRVAGTNRTGKFYSYNEALFKEQDLRAAKAKESRHNYAKRRNRRKA